MASMIGQSPALPFHVALPDVVAPVKTEPLLLKLLLQLFSEIAGFFIHQVFIIVGNAAWNIAGVIFVTRKECAGEPAGVFPLRRRGVLRRGKGWRCREQHQGDNEMFHGNSLEAIFGHVKV